MVLLGDTAQWLVRLIRRLILTTWLMQSVINAQMISCCAVAVCQHLTVLIEVEWNGWAVKEPEFWGQNDLDSDPKSAIHRRCDPGSLTASGAPECSWVTRLYLIEFLQVSVSRSSHHAWGCRELEEDRRPGDQLGTPAGLAIHCGIHGEAVLGSSRRPLGRQARKESWELAQILRGGEVGLCKDFRGRVPSRAPRRADSEDVTRRREHEPESDPAQSLRSESASATAAAELPGAQGPALGAGPSSVRPIGAADARSRGFRRAALFRLGPCGSPDGATGLYPREGLGVAVLALSCRLQSAGGPDVPSPGRERWLRYRAAAGAPEAAIPRLLSVFPFRSLETWRPERTFQQELRGSKAKPQSENNENIIKSKENKITNQLSMAPKKRISKKGPVGSADAAEGVLVINHLRKRSDLLSSPFWKKAIYKPALQTP
ncbi:uncharacterized protein LOC134387478 [Cynocephalus volans]|uniref:uncharacterized protein LOC134387478 n=1 Tax=Cynocephalus volans TaxID=110931 RepID=UPI002FCA1EB2